MNIYNVSLFSMLVIAFMTAILFTLPAKAQRYTGEHLVFENDQYAKALVSKALKHYGSAHIQGDKVVFKKGRYVGFIVSSEDQNQSLNLVAERALRESGLIQRSRVKFRNVNPVTQCDWHKGEVFTSYRKGKHYTLLVCKK